MAEQNKDKLTARDKIVSLAVLVSTFLLVCGISALYAFCIGGELNVSRTMFTYAVIAVLFGGFYIYIFFLDRRVLKQLKSMVLISTVIVVCLAVNLLMGQGLNMYVRPLVLAGLLVAMLVSRNLGLYVNLIECILLFIIDQYCTPGEFTISYSLMDLLLGVICGICFLFLTMRTKRRIDVMMLGITLAPLFAATAVFIEALTAPALGMSLLYAGAWGAACSLLTVVLFMSLLPVFESTFNMVTDYRLMELSDHNNKLLRELAQKAPGTFNHSIVVGNLAEMCALAIGENTNLARAAAYYHDIGKMLNPEYFKENQTGSENPHDDITPEVSVSIIKNHTTNGVKMGMENRLPREILNVIGEHHGTLPIKVFYFKALKYTDGGLALDHYSYDGPKPTGKISAIIMIADACEAAVRVSKDRSEENVEKIVSGIIDERMRLNQFTECDITMHELDVVRETIVNTMSGVFHERIKYPDITFTGGDGVKKEEESKS